MRSSAVTFSILAACSTMRQAVLLRSAGTRGWLLERAIDIREELRASTVTMSCISSVW